MSGDHRPIEQQACVNTDREIWRRQGNDPSDPDNFYQPSMHLTKDGALGINVGGRVYVMDAESWHAMAARERCLQNLLFEFKEALEHSHR